MEVLIKYRNERKKEGASQAELNGLDGRINACMSIAGQEKTAFDIELLNYRAQIASASPVNKDLLARLDTHIFHQLGSTPAKIIVVKIRTISMGPGEGVPVAVDVNNETVGDLGMKAVAAAGLTGNYKIIYNGKHHDDLTRPLSTTGLTVDSIVVICKRLGCDGNCCDRTYSMLADALYRDANKLFKNVKPELIHELFVVFSQTGNKRPKLVEGRVLPEAFRPKHEDSAWAALLSAAKTRLPWPSETLLCEALLAEPLSKEATANPHFNEASNLPVEGLMREAKPLSNTAIAALSKLVSESATATAVPTLNPSLTNTISVAPTSSSLPESDEEDLYG
jgi:hypothetical protein